RPWEAPYRQRWVEAIGPNVIKFIEDFAGDVPADNWVDTKIGSTAGISSYNIEGGGILLYGSGSSDDGFQLQKLAGYKVVDDCPIYFGVRWKVVGAAGGSVSVMMGLHSEDTDVVGSPTDGIVLECASAATGIDLVCIDSGSRTNLVALTTIVADTWYIDEFYWDGAEQIKLWHDGVYIGAAATASIDQTAKMAVTLAYQDEVGNASGTTGLAVDWVRAVQLLDARN
ncbi:unnamed protein product, partial [marine sediment metagenome]